MSLSESLFGDRSESVSSLPAASPQPDIVEQLSDALAGLLVIQNIQRVEARRTSAFVFRGRLLGDAQELYPIISDRFKTLGYTPLMERRGEQDIVVAVEGLVVGRRFASPAWVHALLLLVTIVTTVLSGAQFQGYRMDILVREVFRRGNFEFLWTVFLAGAPFALTLLLILGVHEMGHYIAARRHGVDVTLPYFIPLPFIGILGTLGAVIFIKSPLTSRKALFDVGISGPLAGFVVALVAFILSLGMQPMNRPNLLFFEWFGSERLGMPLLLQWIGSVIPPEAGLIRHVARQPVALAAWFGMFLTFLNLLPIGQLDGGHVLYALFGRAAWVMALVAFSGLIFLGLTLFPSFLFYAVLAMLTGLRHPPPNNDITPLNLPRQLLGYATIVLFFLIGTATPFVIR